MSLYNWHWNAALDSFKWIIHICRFRYHPFHWCICWSLHWRHTGGDSVSNHQPHDCILNGLFRRRSKKTWKLRITGLCAGNSPGTGEFPAQMASNAENVSIWWRHHDFYAYAFRRWRYYFFGLLQRGVVMQAALQWRHNERHLVHHVTTPRYIPFTL